MYKKRQSEVRTNSNTLIVKEGSEPMVNFQKVATLEPYLADIEKRQKQKKLHKASKNSVHESSSRSFRIKEHSTSNHKLNFEKSKQTIQAATKLLNYHKSKPSYGDFSNGKKIKSHDRQYQSSLSKTIANGHSINAKRKNNFSRQARDHSTTGVKDTSAQGFFNDYFLKIKEQPSGHSDAQGQTKQKFRKNMYERSSHKKQASISQHSDVDFGQISNTEINIKGKQYRQTSRPSHQYLIQGKRTEGVRKNNFRRGKFEILHSSVHEKPSENQKQKIESLQGIQPLHSERVVHELQKKESNLSINQEMDVIAEKEMQTFYRQIRTKEIQKSLEKSTEKYFQRDSYRPIKSKNEIQIYVSTIRNPSIHKVSQSTNDKSENAGLNQNKKFASSQTNVTSSQECYLYDFDFEAQPNLERVGHLKNDIQEIENPSEEESYSQNNWSGEDFEKQRKKAQIQFYDKRDPVLDWSDEDICQVQGIE